MEQVWVGNIRHDCERNDLFLALKNRWGWQQIVEVMLIKKPLPEDLYAFVEFTSESEALHISTSCFNILTI